jgi:hypothetical protein
VKDIHEKRAAAAAETAARATMARRAFQASHLDLAARLARLSNLSGAVRK